MLAEISRAAGSCEFSSTPWNQQLGRDEVAIFAKESTVYTGSVESYDFETVLASRDEVSDSYLQAPTLGVLPGAGVKYTLVMGNEYGDKREYSRIPRPDEVAHVDLIQALTSRLSAEATKRVLDSNERFAHTIFKLLRLVRPLSLA